VDVDESVEASTTESSWPSCSVCKDLIALDFEEEVDLFDLRWLTLGEANSFDHSISANDFGRLVSAAVARSNQSREY